MTFISYSITSLRHATPLLLTLKYIFQTYIPMDINGTSLYPNLCRTATLDSIDKLLKFNNFEFAQKKCSSGLSALSYAAQREDKISSEKLLKFLVDDFKLDINQVDNMGQTCLFYTAREGSYQNCLFLINKGINLEIKDSCGQTSLFYAAREGHTKVIKLLVERGANINSIDKVNGETPLFYASVNGHKESLEMMLLELGADPGIRNNYGKTAAFMTRRINGRSISLLLEQKTKKAVQFDKKMAASTSESRLISSKNIKISSFPEISVTKVFELKLVKRKIIKSDIENNLKKLQSPSISCANEISTPSTSASGSSSSLSHDGGETSIVDLCTENKTMTDTCLRKRYRLEFRKQSGNWILATSKELEEFEAQFPGIAIWRKYSKETLKA